MSLNLLGKHPVPESKTTRVRAFELPDPKRLDTQSTDGARRGAAPPPTVAGYEILEELGRGGMGVVYKAWQHSLQRTVALKMVLAGSFARAEDLERFRAEAMAVARLHHPHLLSIYEIGESEQSPFYAMEYMEGGSLSRRLNGQPIEPRLAATLVRPLAEAMDYAHKNGIVHRDLKPANILMSSEGRGARRENEGEPELLAPHLSPLAILKITDFGVAKHLHEESSRTRTGDILGTPHYMAPEQATGLSGQVGPTADVYSLGAILYELLTGRAPFHGFEGAAVLIRLTREDPEPPSHFVRGLPADLHTICLKCLEKDPARRYASAAALADDLGRYLRHEPIQAKPASLVDRAIKWTRRRPGWAAVVAMTFALTLVGFGVMAMMVRQAHQYAAQQDEMVRTWKELLADDYLERGIHLAEKADARRGMHLMLRALEVTEEIERAEKKPHPLGAAIRLNLAAWSQHVGSREKLLTHDDWAWTTAFMPDGKFVLSGGKDRNLKVWDTETGQLVGAPLVHPYPVWALAIHPDGKTVFAASGQPSEPRGELSVWSADPARPGHFLPRGEPMKFDSEMFHLKLNPAGDRLWLASYGAAQGYLVAFDPQAEGNGLLQLRRFDGPQFGGAFSPDGATLATIVGTKQDQTQYVNLWNARTGESLGAPLTHPGAARALAFSKHGRHLIVGSATDLDLRQGETSRLHVWDWAERKPLAASAPLFGRIETLTLAPSGQMFAVSLYSYVQNKSEPKKVTATDGHVELWQLHADGAIDSYGRPLPIGNTVWSMAFSPDSRLLLAGSRNFGAYLWSVPNCERLLPIIWHEGNCCHVAFRADGRQAVTASAGGNNCASARLLDIPAFGHIGPPLPQPSAVRTVFCEDDGVHAWVCSGKFLCRWDPLRGEKVDEIRLPKLALYVQPTREQGRFLLELGDPALHEFRRDAGAIVRLPDLPSDIPHAPRTYSHPKSGVILRLWSRPSRFEFFGPSGKPLNPANVQPEHELNTGLLSPDGNLLAIAETKMGSMTRRLRVYRVSDVSLLHEYPLKNPVATMAFSPDAKKIAMGGTGRQVQVLDLQTGQFEGSPLVLEANVHAIGFIGPNDVLFTTAEKGRMLLWHGPTAKRIGPAIEHGTDLMSIHRHPQGKYLLTGTIGSMAMTWRIPEPAVGSIEYLRLWVETLTGMEMRDRDTIVPLDADRVLAKRRAFAEIAR